LVSIQSLEIFNINMTKNLPIKILHNILTQTHEVFKNLMGLSTHYTLSIFRCKWSNVRSILYIIILFTHFSASAQIGGQYVYAFLKQRPSARLTGLNGSQIALRDDDIAFAQMNPALLNNTMHNAISYNHDFLLAKMSTGYFGYGYAAEKLKMTFQGGVQYINYGSFKQSDEFGNIQGEFKAAEYAVTLGAGRQINESLSAGLNIKYISSQLEAYQSNGLVADLAGAYWNDAKKFGATVVFKNMGAQLSTYSGKREDVPLDVQVGLTKKLQKAPFRVSVALHDLNRWNLRYNNPLNSEITLLGEASSEPSRISKELDNFFRHLNVGGELLLGKNENFRFRVGYSHQVRKEMSVNNLRSMAGFSLGFGFKVSKFRLDYGLGKQHLAGGMNHLSISTNFSEFKKK
jgi:hypothetical protein